MENTNKNTPSGYVLARTIINNRAVVSIVTLETRNAKTGDMVQTWHLLEDVHPGVAVQEGLDSVTVCQGCPFAAGNGCYVNVWQAPAGIWRAYLRGAYPYLTPADYSAVFAGRKIRFGAYGNPSVLPVSIIKAIASVSAGWTGYFHDWRTMHPATARAYGQFLMASAETSCSVAKAEARGLRFFVASPVQPAGTIECLSDSKGISCASCRLCCGLSKARQPSVWINPHGSRKAAALEVAMAS